MSHASKLAERRRVDRTHPALVLLTAAERLGSLPIERLTVLLAQALSRDFGDAALVVHLEDADHHAGPRSRGLGFETDPGSADHLQLPVPSDPAGAAEVLLDRLRPLFHRYAYVFVDAAARGLAWDRHFEDELGRAELRGVVRRLVVLADGDAPPSAAEPWSVLRTRLLSPRSDVPAPASHGARDRVDTLKKLGVRFFERLGGSSIEPQGEPYPASRVVPERCRARIDISAVARQPEPILARLPEASQRAFLRWARALTWRRVGVALGGSGAWGCAHVALLQELEDRGVPVDIIGGSSMGALAGAYYAVMGRAGLELAVERGPRIAPASMITSRVLDLGFDTDLGSARLDDLEILLLPVATDDVPIALVERMGADLLVACNPLRPPRVGVRPPTTALGAFLAELDPVKRLRHLRASAEQMLHDAGDCDEADQRVVYEPPPEMGALLRTFGNGKARALVEEVKREGGFRAAVQRSADAWSRLAAPRAG